MPVGVKVSMVSVTTEALPSLIVVKMSPSGTTAIRCFDGSARTACQTPSSRSGD